LGAHIKFEVHEPIPVSSKEPNVLAKQIEQIIIKNIHYDS